MKLTDHEIHQTFSYGVVYVYSIPDSQHKGRLKIGSATISSQEPTTEEIIAAAKERIDQQTKTADVHYILEHAELALTNDNEYFSDAEVHAVLKRSGFSRKAENTKNLHSEWFEVDLATAKNAIVAVKEGREALSSKEKSAQKNKEFSFRPNQRGAIEQTNKAIKQKRKHFLWNAKMRFGKTSAAMQVAKENNFKKVLIITHRPSVSVDWYNDFNIVFGTGYEYSSKTRGESLAKRLADPKPFVYFASLQDLRLSENVVSDEAANSHAKGFKKNEEIFQTTWDMLIVDEAHEGTQSDLGEATISKIPANFTLELSGTPFNILYKREENEIYTWDYVMEQDEKIHWDERHPGVPNPYSELPALSMFTYDIDKFKSHIGDFGDDFKDSLDGAFKFHEFFRVHKDEQGNDIARFVHEEMVNKFLDLLVNDKFSTKFPYATEEYRKYNKHSLWLLPNRVKVIEAMENLLNNHPILGKFGIVNISGNEIDDEDDKDAKDRVAKAIKNNEYTITLTGQRLTTGVSIPEWTAVFMLSDTSSATTYLQTAFRCQTPANIDGKLKTQGYVFDFAPDRTLRLVAEAIELNHKSGKTNTPEQKSAMQKFLNFCPIIAAEDGLMKHFEVGTMLEHLKKAIIERVRQNGFDDPKLYNDELLKLDELEINKFNNLRAIVGSSTNERTNEIKVNDLGMTDLEIKKAEEDERKKQKTGLTEEEKEAFRKLKEAREQKKSAISILRAVSIRMPMMVYGANVSLKEDITLQKFIDLVDDESWREFMPAGLSKETFKEFTKYYDEEVFRGVTRSIRAKAFDCDDLLPTERMQAIAEIFGTFKNPDKETVLTPWNVVNMQMTLTLGGNDFRNPINGKPVWTSLGVDTSIWSKDDTKILEINSKSGMYPLLAAYNLYSRQLIKHKKPEDKIYRQLWKEVLTKNIYVLCKSPMAVTITRRTLAGYSGAKTNVVYIEELIKKLRREDSYKDYNLDKELQEKFGFENNNMKFTAIVGNPPYQEETKDTSDNPIYHLFIDEAYKLAEKVSLIHPARFLFNAGKTPKEWNKKMLNDEHIKVVYYEQKSSKVFPNTDIKGGIAITYRDASKFFGAIGTFTSFPELNSILNKVENRTGFSSITKIIYSQNKFNLDALYKDFPEYKSIIGSKGQEKRLTTPIFEQLPVFSETKSSNGDYKILGLIKNKRVFKYINQKYLDSHDNIEKFKVILPKSNGTGMLGEALSTPLIAEPLIGHTQSFISIGAMDKEIQAMAILKYLKTKFVRTMLGVLKITQDNPRDVWSKVPLQDFTEKADIDWSKSVVNIDKQLYEKYKLDDNEINFIETHVRAME
ncbi:MAG TPA: Eco57I restriction-modification methylase domain-containing protein [Patescibacteria group bacterium]|nr:Eco57I restriction-modification methylase domain-containing protein [Patescibacteria group bacterium]